MEQKLGFERYFHPHSHLYPGTSPYQIPRCAPHLSYLWYRQSNRCPQHKPTHQSQPSGRLAQGRCAFKGFWTYGVQKREDGIEYDDEAGNYPHSYILNLTMSHFGTNPSFIASNSKIEDPRFSSIYPFAFLKRKS